MDLLTNAVYMIPGDFPWSSLLKDITRALANESQGNFTVQIYHLCDLFWTFRDCLGSLCLETCCDSMYKHSLPTCAIEHSHYLKMCHVFFLTFIAIVRSWKDYNIL